MINISIHNIAGTPTGISATYYDLPLTDEYLVATLELPVYPPLEEMNLLDILSQLQIKDGVLVSDTLKIVSQEVNPNYVEPEVAPSEE